MKKSLLILTFASVLGLCACNSDTTTSETEATSETPSSSLDATSETPSSSKESSSEESISSIEETSSEEISSVEESSSEETNLDAYTISGSVANFLNAVEGATVSISGLETTTDSSGSFTIANVPNTASIISISATGYADISYSVSGLLEGTEENINIGELQIGTRVMLAGSSVEKPSWSAFENFSLYTTRTANHLILRAVSANEIFTSEGRSAQLEFYVAVNEPTTRDSNVFRVVLDNTGITTFSNYGDVDVSSYVVPSNIVTQSGGLYAEVMIPFAALGVTYEETVQISMGEWSTTENDWCPIYQLGSTSIVNSVEDPTTYVYVDQDNTVHLKEGEGGDYDKDTLIADYQYKLASGTEIYAKTTRGSSEFTMDLLGFSDEMPSTNFLRIIIHTASTDSEDVWGLDASDVSFSLYNSVCYYQTNSTSFWENESLGFRRSDSDICFYEPTYTDYDGYWTLSMKWDYSEFGNGITSESTIKGIMVEFIGTTIQNVTGQYFYKDSSGNYVAIGDVARQSNYFTF